MKTASQSLSILGSKGIRKVEFSLDESCSQCDVNTIYDVILEALDVHSEELEETGDDLIIIDISADSEMIE